MAGRAGWVALLICAQAGAQTVLPYSTRTRPYSGWGTTVTGGIRTIGMSGANIGIAERLGSVVQNPAGLAMTLNTAGIQISGNTLFDGNLQDESQGVSATNIVGGGDAYPWGWTVGYEVPYDEGQTYQLNGEPLFAEVFIRKFHASVARVFAKNRFSVGLSFNVAQGNKDLSFANIPENNSNQESYAVGATLGLMYQLPKRWILGLAYSTPLTFAGGKNTQGLAGFSQPIETPYSLGLGVGWKPNRFSSLGFSTLMVGARPGAALLSDQSRLVGEKITLQPRIGFAYKFVELKELTGYFSSGVYYESSRTTGTPGRLHYTAGLEVSPWIFDFGWAIDTAQNYTNFIVSGGIDAIKIMQKLDLIPQAWHPRRRGFFPHPLRSSDVGLPRPLVKRWRRRGPEIDILDTAKKLPKRIGQKIKRLPKDIGGMAKDVADSVKKKRRKKR